MYDQSNGEGQRRYQCCASLEESVVCVWMEGHIPGACGNSPSAPRPPALHRVEQEDKLILYADSIGYDPHHI